MPPTRRLFEHESRRRERARDDMREELEFHLQERTAHLVAIGMDPVAAAAEARRRLGESYPDIERWLGHSAAHKERRLHMRDRMHELADDIRYALRGLAQRPGFTLIAILTLAIGIGANTAIYSAVDALLLRSLPFESPGRLMDVAQATDTRGTAPWSYPKARFFREQQASFASLALHGSFTATISTGEPERVGVEEVGADYLRTLGERVAMGGDFPADLDAAPGARRLALISDALWQRRFNAAPDVVGQSLVLNREPWEIAGVLPPGFRGLSGRAEAIINLSARPADDLNQAWSLEFAMIGRLRDDVSPEQAATEANLLGPRIYEAFPQAEGTLTTSGAPEKWTAQARSLDTIRVASGLRQSLLVLFGAVTLVLLVACVNLANLLLARALARKREVAMRLALGASRGRLVRLLLTESVVLAGLGGVASLGVAWLGTRALSAINPQETLRAQGLQGGVGVVGFETIHLDAKAIGFALATTLVVGILFGLAPAIRATRQDLTRDLKDGSASSGSSRSAGLGRRVLVVAEVALALVLLAGSGLMLRSLGNLLNVDPGFNGDNVLTMRLSMPPGVVSPDSMPGFYERLMAEVASVPGVQQVALADCPPLNNGCNGTIMTFADRPESSTGNALVGVHWVSPNWFATMQVPLRRGRMFNEGDHLTAPKVLVINEAAARKYFPGEDPIGKRVSVYQGGFHTGAEVIGIVGDVRFGTIDSTAMPDAFISYGQARISRMMVFARTTGEPGAMIAPVREAARRIATGAPIYDIMPMSQRVATSSAQARFTATLLGLFAAVALSLAIMGIYGVMSFAVAQRTQEVGIRMALGAGRERVLRLFVREGAVLALAGVAIGVPAALALTRVLQAMLFEVTPSDPWTYAAIVVLLAAAVVLASWVPARRAAGVDPVIALRKG